MNIETLAGPDDNNRDARMAAIRRVARWVRMWDDDGHRPTVESHATQAAGTGQYWGCKVIVSFYDDGCTVWFTVDRDGTATRTNYDAPGLRYDNPTKLVGIEPLGIGAWALPN